MSFVFSRAWDKETILSPHEESDLRPSDFALRCSSAEPQRVDGEQVTKYIYDTHPVVTARISDVVSVMFVNRIKQMGSF